MSTLLPDWLEEAVQEILLDDKKGEDWDRQETKKIMDDALSLKLFNRNVNPNPSAAWFTMSTDEEIAEWQCGDKHLERTLLERKKLQDETKRYSKEESEGLEGIRYRHDLLDTFDMSKMDNYREIPIENITMQQVRNLGSKRVTLCPFHDDKKPSCVLYGKNGFYCFSCGASGNAVDWTMREFDLNFRSAIKYLEHYV